MTDAASRPHVRTALVTRYRAALRLHLRGRTSTNGDRAQGLGRAAVAGGLATRDLALIHDEALVELSCDYDFAKTANGSLSRAGHFFSEALIPLEAVLQATRASNRQLLQRNKTLRVHTAALAKLNRKLEREVTRRKSGEEAVKKGKQRYQELFRESQVMQKNLRSVTRQIIFAQEEERKEISRELHDEVVQTLVGINVQLSALCRGTLDRPRVLRAKIARTQRLVEASVKAVHRFARGLRPAVLDDLGLIPALHAYCKAVTAKKAFKIQLTAFSGVEALDGTGRTVLYRVAQEALTNVVRHAQAAHVRVSITEGPGAIRLEVSDDGRSFCVDKTLLAKNNRRLGLVGMRERIEMIGGHLEITSVSGEGTTVRAEIPFKQPTGSL